jgi:DNA-binding transcriptional LysR family regulator
MIENFRVRVFRSVAEEGSFRKASDSLNLSQPAVSQHIHALEEELGLRLVDRSSIHISLTAPGRILLEYAQKAALLDQQIEVEFAALRGETGGELRLGASTTVAQYVLPRMLGAFLRDNPKVQLRVKSGNTEEVVEWLTGAEIDLGLIEGPAMSKQVQTENFLEDTMILIAPKDHPWSTDRLISIHDLVKAPLLVRERGSGSRRVVESALKNSGLRMKELKVAMELDSTEAIVSGVEAGLGVGIVSQWAVGKELHLGTVVHITVSGLEVSRNFALVRLAGPLPDGVAGEFRRFALAQKSATNSLVPSARKVKRPIRKSNQP